MTHNLTSVFSRKEYLLNSLHESHRIVQSVVKQGDTVVDATMGNGNDTAFLAELVGAQGKVFSFDIQLIAVQRTRRLLEEKGLLRRVVLLNDGHENMDRYVPEHHASAVMFNLGYLPKGDHSISTKPDTTIKAIEKSLNIIKTNGIVSIVVYYGGDSGFEEKEKVISFVSALDNKKYTVMKREFINQPNCPPILICIEKIK